MINNFWQLLLSWLKDLKTFLRGWLLVLGLEEGLVECATLCIKSWVILLYLSPKNNVNHISRCFSIWVFCAKMLFVMGNLLSCICLTFFAEEGQKLYIVQLLHFFEKEIQISPKWNPCSWHLSKSLMKQEGTNICYDADKMMVFSCSRQLNKVLPFCQHSNKTMFVVS